MKPAFSVKLGYGSCLGMTTMASLLYFKKIDPSKFTISLMLDRYGRFERREAENGKSNINVISWSKSSESAEPVRIDGSIQFAQCDIQVWVPRSIIPARSEVKSLGDKGAIWLFDWWLEGQIWYPKRKSPQP